MACILASQIALRTMQRSLKGRVRPAGCVSRARGDQLDLHLLLNRVHFLRVCLRGVHTSTRAQGATLRCSMNTASQVTQTHWASWKNNYKCQSQCMLRAPLFVCLPGYPVARTGCFVDCVPATSSHCLNSVVIHQEGHRIFSANAHRHPLCILASCCEEATFAYPDWRPTLSVLP